MVLADLIGRDWLVDGKILAQSPYNRLPGRLEFQARWIWSAVWENCKNPWSAQAACIFKAVENVWIIVGVDVSFTWIKHRLIAVSGISKDVGNGYTSYGFLLHSSIYTESLIFFPSNSAAFDNFDDLVYPCWGDQTLPWLRYEGVRRILRIIRICHI